MVGVCKEENYSVEPLRAARPLQPATDRLAQRGGPCRLPQPSPTALDCKVLWAVGCDPFFLKREICREFEKLL